MYMIKFHMRITLLPTAPSMFQNQKLKKKLIYSEEEINEYILEDLSNISRKIKHYKPEEKGIESFVPQLTPDPKERIPENVVDLRFDYNFVEVNLVDLMDVTQQLK